MVTRGNDLSFRPGQPAYRGAVLGAGDGAVQSGPGFVPVVLPGRRQSVPLTGRRAAWPRARWPGASRWVLPGGQRGLSAAAPGARRPHQGHRRPAACPETWPAVPPAISRRPGTPARCLAARAWRRPASAAGARTVSRLMPATGSGRDTAPGPAPEDRPAPPSRAAGRGHDTGAAVTCAFTAMAGIRRAAPGIPGGAGMAWRDWRWRAASASCRCRCATRWHRRNCGWSGCWRTG